MTAPTFSPDPSTRRLHSVPDPFAAFGQMMADRHDELHAHIDSALTQAQRREAQAIAARLFSLARHPATPPSLFIELGRNMEEALKAGDAS